MKLPELPAKEAILEFEGTTIKWLCKKSDVAYGEACYAAGMAAGEAKERERAEMVERAMEQIAKQTRPY